MPINHVPDLENVNAVLEPNNPSARIPWRKFRVIEMLINSLGYNKYISHLVELGSQM